MEAFYSSADNYLSICLDGEELESLNECEESDLYSADEDVPEVIGSVYICKEDDVKASRAFVGKDESDGEVSFEVHVGGHIYSMLEKDGSFENTTGRYDEVPNDFSVKIDAV